MRYISPAKINLFLRILRRREDGYHDLASLFQAIDLHDVLTVVFSDEEELACSDPHLPLDRSNLVWKAVDLFRKKTGLFHPLKIHLEKKIPVQAGIGGGSSNAATILFALNQIHETNLSDMVLSAWSAEIGSDISFFFSSGRAFCTGRGEKVLSLEKVESPSLWLVKPPRGLSTPLIFKTLDISSCSSLDPKELLVRNEKRIVFQNDLEKPAFQIMPELADLKNQLMEQGFEVSLTGSGTGLICLGENKPEIPSEIKIYPLKYLTREKENWYHL